MDFKKFFLANLSDDDVFLLMQQNNIFWSKMGQDSENRVAHPHNSQGYPSGAIPSSERILLSHHNIKDLEVRRKYFSSNLLFNSVRYVMKHCLLFDIMLFDNFFFCSVGRLAQVQ